MQSELSTWQNSVTGQEPLKKYIWLASVERRRCSNAAKTRNPLKFAGVPQTIVPISAASGPSRPLWEHVEEILVLNKFFSDCRYVP